MLRYIKDLSLSSPGHDLCWPSRPGAEPELLPHVGHPLPAHVDGPLFEQVPGARTGVLIGKCKHHEIAGAKCTGRDLDRGHIARQLPARKLLLEFTLGEVR